MKSNMWNYANAVSAICVTDDEVRNTTSLRYACEIADRLTLAYSPASASASHSRIAKRHATFKGSSNTEEQAHTSPIHPTTSTTRAAKRPRRVLPIALRTSSETPPARRSCLSRSRDRRRLRNKCNSSNNSFHRNSRRRLSSNCQHHHRYNSSRAGNRPVEEEAGKVALLADQAGLMAGRTEEA